MNISGAQRGAKNVQKALVCVPSAQNRTDPLTSAGRGYKVTECEVEASSRLPGRAAASLREQTTTRRGRAPVSLLQRQRSNGTNIGIRRGKKISNGMKESSEATGTGCWMFKPRETCGLKSACGRAGVHAASFLMRSCTGRSGTCTTDSLCLSPTAPGPAGDTKGAAHPRAQLHLQSGLLREILSRR